MGRSSLSKRLLIVSGSLTRICNGERYLHGGLGRHVDAFARRFEHVYLLTSVEHVPVPPDEYRLQSRNLSIIPVRSSWHPSRPRRYLLEVATMLEAIAKLPGAMRQSDVIHARLPKAVGNAGALMARFTSKPVFFYLAGDWEAAVRAKGQSAIYRALGAAIQSTLRFLVNDYLCFTAGEPLARKFGGPNDRMIPVMTTAIDRSHVVSPDVACLRAERQPREILFVGGVWEGKGVHILLEAVHALRRRGLNVRLRLIGKQAAGNGWLQRQVERWGLEGVVTYHPHMAWDCLIWEYEKSDIFVLPSIEGRGEGVPKVVLEAMARGLPVIATDVGGVSTLVKPWENGLLVRAGSPDELAEAIALLWNDVQLRKKLVTHATQTAMRYDLNSLIDTMVDTVLG